MIDLDAVAWIERQSFSDPWTVDALTSALRLAHSRFLVAEETGDAPEPSALTTMDRAGVPALVGYVLALMVADEAEIADLAVTPKARRRGIGGMLLDRVVVEARQAGVRTLYLEVRESNAAALALYRSRGFEAVGRRRGYYRHPPEDALLLKRDLGPV